MITRSEELEADIAALELQIKPLEALRQRKLTELRRAKSLEFIKLYDIKKVDVELSLGTDKPWFGSVEGFRRWLSQNAVNKRWVEWNGRIHSTNDIIHGDLTFAPGLVEDLE